MDKVQSSEVVIEMAKILIGLASEVCPGWEKAFYRFESDGSYTSANGSYVNLGEAEIFSTMTYSKTFERLREYSLQLRDALEKDGRKFLVCLLTVDSGFNFDAEYEYRNSDRWRISKFEGATGFPS